MIVPTYKCSKPDHWTSPRPWQDISARPRLLAEAGQRGILRRFFARYH